ncbi:hypothetical protein ANN_12012 [Periplaneta americana]|uniref:RNase H type-1 domain-containing protein n=1 Tax=Periplaneta americana TaxID=6978 RepID=A0ABQ8T7T5_PERAM|nr:hypothetical protein ANN_12012 [Periplaneta americana]
MAGLCEGGNEPSGSLKAILLEMPTSPQQPKKKIVFQWISAHCGLTGNNAADYLAKKGCGNIQKPANQDFSCHNPGDPRNETVRLTGFLELGKDATTLPPCGFDGYLSILLNEEVGHPTEEATEVPGRRRAELHQTKAE